MAFGKKSAHRATMRDVLQYLADADGPKLADDIGAHFWPDKVGFGPARGGPASVAVSASYMLGKMARKGWVDKDSRSRRWSITATGLKRLLESD